MLLQGGMGWSGCRGRGDIARDDGKPQAGGEGEGKMNQCKWRHRQNKDIVKQKGMRKR